MPLRVAYLITEYPKISHAFIRREILALERQDVDVMRIALRGWGAQTVDQEDRDEQRRTRYILKGGPLPLLVAVVRTLVERPARFLSALAIAIRFGRRADRPLRYHLIYLAEACRALYWLEAAGVSHVHAHFATNATEVAVLIDSLGGPKYSFTVHGPDEFDKPEFLHIAEKIRRSAFVVAITSFTRSQLFRWVEHAYWSKIEVVHCGLESAFYEAEATPVISAIPAVAYVGRLSPQKGPLILVEAARLLVAKGIRFEIVLIGGGEMRSDIETLVERYHLSDVVRLTGSISTEQLRRELQRSRALVLPSFAEGLPMVIMEAMALRKPVLTTYIAGIPELVVPDVTGWLFPAGSVDALASAIESVLSLSEQELRWMGDAAYERVRSRHSIDIEVLKLCELFRNASKEAPAS